MLKLDEWYGVIGSVLLIVIVFASYKIHDAELKIFGRVVHGVAAFFTLFLIFYATLNELFYYGGLIIVGALTYVIGGKNGPLFGTAIFVAGFVALLFVGDYLEVPVPSSDCYTDWDGRSNPVMCN